MASFILNTRQILGHPKTSLARTSKSERCQHMRLSSEFGECTEANEARLGLGLCPAGTRYKPSDDSTNAVSPLTCPLF
jgi:hypothetical protein